MSARSARVLGSALHDGSSPPARLSPLQGPRSSSPMEAACTAAGGGAAAAQRTRRCTSLLSSSSSGAGRISELCGAGDNINSKYLCRRLRAPRGCGGSYCVGVWRLFTGSHTLTTSRLRREPWDPNFQAKSAANFLACGAPTAARRAPPRSQMDARPARRAAAPA